MDKTIRVIPTVTQLVFHRLDELLPGRSTDMTARFLLVDSDGGYHLMRYHAGGGYFFKFDSECRHSWDYKLVAWARLPSTGLGS